MVGAEITFEKGSPEIFKLLLTAFEIKNPKCEYCGEKVDEYSIGGFMPNFRKKCKEPIVLCRSPLCMCEYINDEEEYREERDKNEKEM